VAEYRENKDKELEEITPLRPYVLHTQTDALGTVVTGGHNYVMLPVRPLCANSERRSELTPAIKSKIDAYDCILSDFADNLDRANDVYWVLNNFGGSMDDVAELLEQINRLKAVSNLSDGTGAASTAEPHTIEVPYAAREKALDLLEKALYQDYMALDMDELTGGSLTNVAIRAATANLNLKANRYEWQVRQFVRQILLLAGIESDEIRFKRQSIANESETVADIAVMRDYIDKRTALKINPYIQEDEIEEIITRQADESVSGFSDMTDGGADDE
jgi:SPP1 family phage portal protein